MGTEGSWRGVDTPFPDWEARSWASGKTAQRDCEIALIVFAFLSNPSQFTQHSTNCCLCRGHPTYWYGPNFMLARIPPCEIKYPFFCVLTSPALWWRWGYFNVLSGCLSPLVFWDNNTISKLYNYRIRNIVSDQKSEVLGECLVLDCVEKSSSRY